MQPRVEDKLPRLIVGDVTIDPATRTVEKDNASIAFTTVQFDLLHLLFSSGQVTSTTVYPGWYQGRATHIHVEVTRSGRSLKVTQIAFPDSVNTEVYGSGVYASRGSSPTTNTRDNIFADGLNSELASVSGGPSSGYTATFTVGLAA